MPSLAQLEDRERIARILARLDVDDAAWLGDRLAEPWQRRARRIAARDAAIRDYALGYHPLESGRAMAAAIAVELARYCASAFRFEADLAVPGDPRRAALWKILHLNQRRTMSPGAVRAALAGVVVAFGQKKPRKLATAPSKRSGFR